MIHEDENHLIIKIYGCSKEDIPRFLLALSDAIKYMHQDYYDFIRENDSLYYIGLLMDAILPSQDQFLTIKLSE